MRNLKHFVCVFALFLLLVFIPSTSGLWGQPGNPPASDKHGKAKNAKVVYVCACLQDRSCSCMTEAKMEGPCACGTQGGPPMKAVAPDSNWAKENRDALAK